MRKLLLVLAVLTPPIIPAAQASTACTSDFIVLENAELIVEGTVTDIEFIDEGLLPQSINTISIEKYLKGSSGREIQVIAWDPNSEPQKQEPGGPPPLSVSGIVYHSFFVGEKVGLALSEKNEQGYYPISQCTKQFTPDGLMKQLQNQNFPKYYWFTTPNGIKFLGMSIVAVVCLCVWILKRRRKPQSING